MKRAINFIIVLCTMFLLASGYAESGVNTITFTVSSGKDDGVNKISNGAASLGTGYAYIGKDYVMGWRFQNATIPQGVTILNATLDFFTTTYQVGNSVKIRYSGEKSDNARALTTTAYDLVNRDKTSAAVDNIPAPWASFSYNKSPDLAPVIQEIVNRPGWQSGNALLLLAGDNGSSSSRTLFMYENGVPYRPKLTITYSDVPPVPPPPVGTKCEFDTNHDGIPDIILYDTDGDGYCELPAGKVEYNGILVIDKPIEIVWNPHDPGQTGVFLKGHALVITDGGKIVSELVLHNGSIANPQLNSLAFSAEMTNSIEIELGAEIFLGGTLDGRFDGDISLKTTRPYAKIFLQGDPAQENTWLYGRNVTITSSGSIYVTDKLWVEANSKITLETPQGDIYVGRESTVWAGRTSDIILKAGTPATPTIPAIIGNVNLSGDVELAAVTINMCGVTGTKNDDGTTTVIGTKVCW
jgi:hypothetical protein